MSESNDTNVPPIQSPEPEETWVEPEALPGIPFPPSIRVFFAVVAIAFVFAITRVPHAIAQGIKYEQGHRAFEYGDMKKAASLLAPIVKEFPNASDVRIDLAQAYAESGQDEAAIRELDTFNGQMVTEEEEVRLNSISQTVIGHLPPSDEKETR